MRLDPDDLRGYARRDWRAPERLARRMRAGQPVPQKVALAVSLYEAARATTPGWPDPTTRRRDLQSHVNVRRLLQRAAHVGAR